MRLFFRSAVASALCLALGSSALADGVIRDGVGAISIGRGGTNLGFADNGAIILDNPAGMSNIAGNSLMDIGVDTVICDLQYSDPENPGVDADVTGFPSGMFGYVRRAPCSPWSWGFGVYAPAGFGADFHMQNSDTNGDSLYKSLGAMIKVLPAVSYQVTDDLSIGATLGLGVCHAELEGPFYTQTGPFTNQASLLDLQGTDVALTGGVGLQYRLTPNTMLGIAYTEETRFDFDGSATVTFPPGFPMLGGISSGFDANFGIVWPRSLGVGIKHDLCCCRRLGVDVIWYDWSHAFDQLELNLTNPSNPMLGGAPVQDVMALDWHDTVSFRFGYEWDAYEDLTWRLGYVYHDSPVENSTLTPYLDGVLEHAFSLGFSRKLDKATVNLAYQYSFGPTREIEDSALAGDDFSNSTFEAEAHWIGLSVLIPR